MAIRRWRRAYPVGSVRFPATEAAVNDDGGQRDIALAVESSHEIASTTSWLGIPPGAGINLECHL